MWFLNSNSSEFHIDLDLCYIDLPCYPGIILYIYLPNELRTYFFYQNMISWIDYWETVIVILRVDDRVSQLAVSTIPVINSCYFMSRRCSICKHDLSYTPGITGTSAMRQHLINKHDIPLTSKARNSVSLLMNLLAYYSSAPCVIVEQIMSSARILIDIISFLRFRRYLWQFLWQFDLKSYYFDLTWYRLYISACQRHWSTYGWYVV